MYCKRLGRITVIDKDVDDTGAKAISIQLFVQVEE
jgi:hypothetical protein